MRANGDATRLPFPDDTFDRVIASEVLEHIPDDAAALAELVRVLQPGGTIAVTVPTWLPEQVCWALTDEYHAPSSPAATSASTPSPSCARSCAAAGLAPGARPPRPRAALAVLVAEVRGRPDQRRPSRWCSAYHRLLVWDIVEPPADGTLTRLAEPAAQPGARARASSSTPRKPHDRSEHDLDVTCSTSTAMSCTAAELAAHGRRASPRCSCPTA